ncbi:MAG: RHS repeat-associated core domain-containing protein [Acidobacteriota bacterium]
MIAKASGPTIQYFVSDRLSVRMTVNSSGNVVGRQGHLPFGEDFGASGTQEKHHFTSYERDVESGLDYAVNRSYSPILARFMRVDPYDGSSSLNNPQSLNRYAYVQNGPINSIDPLGLCLCANYYDEGRNLRWTDCWLCNAKTKAGGGGGGGGRGGGGNAGGGGQGAGPGGAARAQLEDFLNKFEKCSQKLETLTRSSTGFNPEELAEGITFRSYESYGMFATFRSQGLVGRGDPVANIQIRVLLGPLAPSGSFLGAWTSPISPVVILGASYFSASPDRQGAIVAHEMLHVANPNLTHQALAGMLGVDYEKGPNPGANEDAANKALTEWIEKGCQDPPDKK